MVSRPVPPFTLKQLAYLSAAATAGNISSAARQLHVSPSAMSDAITELEHLVGERLCVRKRAHGLTLTPAGERLMQHATRMLAEAEDITHTLGGQADTLTGPIVIGCYPTLAPMILPPLLQEFAALHPGLELSMFEATQDQLAEALGNGHIDVAFVYDTLVPPDTSRAPLFGLPAHVVLPADHRLAGAKAVKLEQLVTEDLILLDAPPSSEHTLALFTERGLTPRVRHRTASYEVVRTLVARGLGYGVLVSRVANTASYEGLPLVTIPITPAVKPVLIEMIWAPDHPLPARTRALIEFAQGHPWAAAN